MSENMNIIPARHMVHTDKYGTRTLVLVMLEDDAHYAGKPLDGSGAILFKAPKSKFVLAGLKSRAA